MGRWRTISRALLDLPPHAWRAFLLLEGYGDVAPLEPQWVARLPALMAAWRLEGGPGLGSGRSGAPVSVARLRARLSSGEFGSF